jgi:catechol 2,3-dioxygenase-like lactoylglutathione lyase family enzyme
MTAAAAGYRQRQATTSTTSQRMVRILSPHDEGDQMLADGQVATRLPAQDLDRARAFYAEKLGLEAVDERPGGLLYRCGEGEFALFQSSGASPGTFTQMGWSVDDLDATVATLKERGVQFEEVDVPGLRTVDSIAQVEGNYPSKNARGERAAWFRDSEGNLLGVGEPVR